MKTEFSHSCYSLCKLTLNFHCFMFSPLSFLCTFVKNDNLLYFCTAGQHITSMEVALDFKSPAFSIYSLCNVDNAIILSHTVKTLQCHSKI